MGVRCSGRPSAPLEEFRGSIEGGLALEDATRFGFLVFFYDMCVCIYIYTHGVCCVFLFDGRLDFMEVCV